MRQILTLSRRYWVRLAMALLFLASAAAASLVVPLGIRALMDSMLARHNQGELNRLAGLLVLLLVLRAGLNAQGSYWLRCTGERIVAELRSRVFRHTLSLGVPEFDKQRVGDLVSRLGNDAASIRSAATDAVVNCFLQTAYMVGSAVLMLAMNVRLGALVVCAVPCLVLLSRYFGPYLKALARNVQNRLADSTVIAEEALAAIKVVKAFGRESYEAARYSAAIEAVFATSRSVIRTVVVFSSSIDLLFVSVNILIFWRGGSEVLAGRMTAGSLVAFLLYTQHLSQSLAEVTQVYATFLSAAGASERVFELMRIPPETVPGQPRTVRREIRGALTFDAVEFAHGRSPVLKNVSFHIEAGERVALVGLSGAGKSTILNLILRFYEPQGGRILIDGQDIRTLDLHSLRDRIAVAPQDARLFRLSIRDNIRYGRLDAAESEIEAAAAAANVDGFALRTPEGYDSPVGDNGNLLSGGQRQRVAIARALVRDASILLLDEPTSSVDSIADALIQEALDRVAGDKTILIVAHRLSTIVKADRILTLHNGQIVEAGTHAELLAGSGLYSALNSRQRGADFPAACA